MKTLFLFFVLLPFLSLAQRLKVNEYDKFIKERRIELEPIQISSSEKANISLAFNAVRTDLFVQISGYGWGATTIDPGEKAIFLFANDSTITVTSIALQSYQTVSSSLQNTYKHTYFIREADVKLLSENDVVAIRKYGSNDFSDLRVSNDKSDKIRKLSTLFIEELKKAKIFGAVKDINLADISRHVGDSVRFCSKVYNTRYFETSPNKPTLLDVNNSYSNQFVSLLIWEQDRNNFPNSPESLYLKKDICVRGVVELYNNSPRIIVRNRDQIIIKTPVSVTEIASFVGDSITVTGRITTAKSGEATSDSPTILNMAGEDPNQLLTLIIDGKDRGNFNSPPETYYLDKQISVTGRVELSGGKPQIVVQNKNQIKEEAGQSTERIVRSVDKSTPASAEKQQGKPASFPGGHAALLHYLKDNLVAPQNQLKMGEKKVVVAKFVINPDGSATDIRIIQPAGKDFDKEVIRVLKQMPKWQPQTEDGVPVAVSVTQPVTFFRQETANRAKR